MAVIKTQNLHKHFGNTHAVNGIDLSVAEGEIFGLVGPDGAGKTTSIRLLTSIMEPTKGNAWVNGHPIVEGAEAVKSQIGYMSQKFGLYSDLTVLENMQFYADIYGVSKKEQTQKIRRLLAFSKLEKFKDRLADALSGGMKQKLGLACALIHTPKVLFLDEPTNGVDPVSRREFWRILYDLHREGTTIFLATSYMEEAERCGQVAFMYHGKIMIHGSPDDIKKHLRGTILEVRCKAPRKTLLMLREALGHDCVKLFGNRIHIYIYTESKALSLEQVKDLLQRSQLGEYEIRETDPTLEDVFMSLMRDKEKEDADVRY
ncbi:MAG: ABC transporter ATP-binding protein [Chlamydiota bacterium]|nr:ABC transporter ATP-binding protein [Chlamydiota bacterium]